MFSINYCTSCLFRVFRCLRQTKRQAEIQLSQNDNDNEFQKPLEDHLPQIQKYEELTNDNVSYRLHLSLIQQKDKKEDLGISFQSTEDSHLNQINQQFQEMVEEKETQQNLLLTFIQSTPTIDPNDQATIRSIAQNAEIYFLQIINQYDDMEQLSSDPEFLFYFKSYQNSEKFNVTVMRYTFLLKTTMEQYQEFVNNFELQQQLDKQMDALERSQGDQNLSINYLRFKKILFMDPREFIYIKQFNQTEDCLIEVTKSVNIQDFEPRNKSKKPAVRAQLLLTGSLIKKIDDNMIEVTTYSETDMRLKMSPLITKKQTCSEVKKMIERMKNYFHSK